MSTLNTSRNDLDHLLHLGSPSSASENYYRQMLQNFKKRKQIEPVNNLFSTYKAILVLFINFVFLILGSS